MPSFWFWGLFVAVLSIYTWIVFRASRFRGGKPKLQKYRFGLAWYADGRAYWGPCCEDCRKQFMLRPAFRSPEGVQFYELTCPGCSRVLAGQAFTLQALLDVDRQVANRLRLARFGPPLAPQPEAR